jgi:hypothetical protein
MSTPAGATIAPYSTAQSPANPPVNPAAVSSGKSSAIYALGEVLKTMIHKTLAFSTESDLDNAVRIVDKFVGAFVPGSEMSALLTGDARAAKEDVSLRVPPQGAAVISGPVLDYTKLAQAILAEQKRLEAGGDS